MGGKKGPKKCPFCDYTHRLSAQVRRHQLQSHGEHALECTMGCGARVAYNRMARHIREQHPEMIRPEGEEGMRMKEEREAMRKKRKKMDRGRDKENDPNNRTTDQNVAASSTEPSVSPFPMDGVLAGAALASSAAGHLACAQCGALKPSRGALRKHIARVHERRYKREEPREKRHQCPEEGCGKRYTTAGKLEDHMNTQHTGLKPFSCDHCRRDFGSRAEYGRHLRKYHGTSLRQISRQIEQLMDDMGTGVGVEKNEGQ